MLSSSFQVAKKVMQITWHVKPLIRKKNLILYLYLTFSTAFTEQARQADHLVEMCGVAAHLGYTDTPYWLNWSSVVDASPTLKSLVFDLGIRHIRDGIPLGTGQTDSLNRQKLVELHSHGINLTGILAQSAYQTLDTSRISRDLKRMEELQLGPMMNAIEGPNEYDLFNPLGQSNSQWPNELLAFQKHLYTTVKKSSVFKNTPIYGPTIGIPGFNGPPAALKGIVDYCDYGNGHPYPGGGQPEWNALSTFQVQARKMSGNKSLVATETGYNTAIDYPTGNAGISERADGIYTPRLLMYYFKQGFHKVFLYELMDIKPDPGKFDESEHHYGLIRLTDNSKPTGTPVGIAPKASYKALKNLLKLFNDPGPDFIPKALAYHLEGDLTDIQTVLLQKRNGTFFLVLWNQKPVFDLKNRVDITLPERKLTVQFDQDITETRLYRPGTAETIVNLKTSSKPSKQDISVYEDIVVLEIKPALEKNQQIEDQLKLASEIRILTNFEYQKVSGLAWKGDTSGIMVKDNTKPASVTYSRKSLRGFEIEVGMVLNDPNLPYEKLDFTNLKFFCSSDKNIWTEIAVKALAVEPAGDAWARYPSTWKTRLVPVAAVPAGTNYLMIENVPGKTAPYLFSVSLVQSDTSVSTGNLRPKSHIMSKLKYQFRLLDLRGRQNSPSQWRNRNQLNRENE